MPPQRLPCSATLPGADTLAPREEGSYDGLCGLYAVVNALTLALLPHAPLTRQQMHSLFTSGLTTLEQAYMLHAAVRDGLPVKLWHRVLDELCAAAATLTGMAVEMEYAFSTRVTRATMFAELEEAIRHGHPILLPVGGVLDRYTVISAYTVSSLRLFDSSGLRWFKRASCAANILDRHFRHRLDITNARVIRVEKALADD